MPVKVNVYPLRDSHRIAVDTNSAYDYDRLENLLWALRFNRKQMQLGYEGNFNYRNLAKMLYRSQHEYEGQYDIAVHPLIQERYDRWEAKRQALARISRNTDLNLADDYFRAEYLWPFQRVDAKFAYEAKKALLFHEMGAGKTIITAAALEMARKFDGVRKVLIICPSAVRTNWKQELIKWTTIPSFIDDTGRADSHHIIVANAATSADRMWPVLQAVLTDAEHILIINWETLRIPWFDQFLISNAPNFDMIIADEAHRVRNLKTSVTAQNFIRMHAKYQFALTGTSVVNYPEDMFALIHWMYPDQYDNYDVFSEDFVERPRKALRKASTQVIVEKIDLELDYMMVRREKEDVMPWLPKKRVDPIYVSLYPKQRIIYEQMRDELITVLSGDNVVDAPIKLTQIMRLKQIAISPAAILLSPKYSLTNKAMDVSDPIVQKADESPKLDYCIDWIESMGDDKVVIFSQFEGVIKLLEHRLLKLQEYKNKELRYCYVTGDSKHISGHEVKDDREKGLDAIKVLETAFQEDPDVRVWLGTIKTGGEGITLTAACNLISIDQWWNAATMNQGDDRLHRGGQERPVRIHRLIAHDTVELEILELIAKKELSFSEMVRTGKLLEILLKDKARQMKEAA